MRFQNKLLYGQFIRFAATGVMNTFVDWATYFSFTRLVTFFGNFLVGAKIISFIVASVFAFLAHRYWTFGERSPIGGSEIVKFYTTTISAMAINAVGLYLFLPIFNGNDVVALIGATAVTMIWNFSFLKFWVYGRTPTRTA